MFTIGIAGLKGGIGKSTVAWNLASALHHGDGTAATRRVLLVDADRQGTCRGWAARAAETGAEGPPVVAIDGDRLRADLKRIASSFDVVVIDSPPQLAETARAILLASDVVLLPVIPGSADAWSLAETIGLVRRAQALKPALLAAIVLNRADRTNLSRDAALHAEDLELPVLPHLSARVTFGEATLHGQGVVDYDGKSDAAFEMRRLTRAAMTLGGLS